MAATALKKREAELARVVSHLEEQADWAEQHKQRDLASAYLVAQRHVMALLAEVQSLIAKEGE